MTTGRRVSRRNKPRAPPRTPCSRGQGCSCRFGPPPGFGDRWSHSDKRAITESSQPQKPPCEREHYFHEFLCSKRTEAKSDDGATRKASPSLLSSGRGNRVAHYCLS